MKSRSVMLTAILAGIVGGCVAGPTYRSPIQPMPDRFDAGPGSPSTSPVARVSPRAPDQRPVEISRWWQSLGDAQIDSLVERSVKENLDLKIALIRLQESRVSESVVTGGALPLVDAAAGAGRGTGSDSTRGRIPGPLHSAANTSKLSEITEVAGFDAIWEADLFGRFARELEAARADTQAVAEARNDVLISVVSEVARVYVVTRAQQMRLAITLDNLQTARQTYQLVNARFNQGLTNELDVQLSRRQLATVASQVAPLQESIVQAQRRLAVLLGLPPQTLYSELQQPATVPTPPEHVTAGQPVDLLRRRPDIRRAERQLAASTARIGVATANLFPRVDLVGAFGMQGQGLGRTPVEEKSIWSFGPAAYWPVLDFGVLDSIVQVQDLRTRELLYNYRRTVLLAVEEVDNAIGNYLAQRERLTQLDDAVAASRQALKLASQRYERGLSDFLNVLDAQRQLYDLEDQYAVAQEGVVVQFIALYKALGGGWEPFERVPSMRGARPAIIAAGTAAVWGFKTGHPVDSPPTSTP